MSIENQSGRSPFSSEWNPGVRRKLEAQYVGVLARLQEANLDPSAMLFAGYNPAMPKEATQDDEFRREDGTYEYYFGDANSLQPPELTEDTETAEERVMVNPLTYAEPAGAVLGVFDAQRLAEWVQEADEEFGTYTVVAPTEVVDAARVATLDLHQ